MEKEIEISDELEEHLQEMKRLLKKKERSLSKYNRVKRVKDHVRKTVLKKNFENSCNDSLAVSKIKKDASIINASNCHLKSVSLKNPLTADDSPSLSNGFNKIKSNGKLIAHDCSEVKETSFCSNLDSINVPFSILKRSLSLESCLNDSTNIGTLTSDSTTPIIQTKRLSKGHLNKKHVKRLFSNNNNNNYNYNDYNICKVTTEQFKRIPCKIVDSKHSHTLCCVNSEENLVSLSNSQSIKPNVEICQKLENENNSEEIERFKDTSRKEDNYISKCKPVSEDNCILNDSPNKVIATCIASIPGKSPHIIVLYSSGFSIWALYNEETEHGSKFYWQKNVDKDVAFKNIKSSFIFGSGSLHCIYFMLIKAPSGINRPFEVDFVCLSSLEQVVIVEDYLPLRGCAECSFSCCDLQDWKFLYSFHSCKNEFCPNFKRSQALYIFSFDLIYSEKMQKWDLTFQIEKEHIFEHILLSTVLLNKCEDMVMWCDASGNFGFVDINYNYYCPKSVLNLELKKELSSSQIIYAASLKEILLVVLKSEERLKFVAMNPLNCEFEIFYEIPLRNLNMTEETRCSVIFYERRFYFATTLGTIISFEL